MNIQHEFKDDEDLQGMDADFDDEGDKDSLHPDFVLLATALSFLQRDSDIKKKTLKKSIKCLFKFLNSLGTNNKSQPNEFTQDGLYRWFIQSGVFEKFMAFLEENKTKEESGLYAQILVVFLEQMYLYKVDCSFGNMEQTFQFFLDNFSCPSLKKTAYDFFIKALVIMLPTDLLSFPFVPFMKSDLLTNEWCRVIDLLTIQVSRGLTEIPQEDLNTLWSVSSDNKSYASFLRLLQMILLHSTGHFCFAREWMVEITANGSYKDKEELESLLSTGLLVGNESISNLLK